jgi:hypothetical protein
MNHKPHLPYGLSVKSDSYLDERTREKDVHDPETKIMNLAMAVNKNLQVFKMTNRQNELGGPQSGFGRYFKNGCSPTVAAGDFGGNARRDFLADHENRKNFVVCG